VIQITVKCRYFLNSHDEYERMQNYFAVEYRLAPLHSGSPRYTADTYALMLAMTHDFPPSRDWRALRTVSSGACYFRPHFSMH
jgi:hypothetical protein